MKFRFLTLTLVLAMALSSVSVFADNAVNNTPPPVPTLTNDGTVTEPIDQPENETTDTVVSGDEGADADNALDQPGNIASTPTAVQGAQGANANEGSGRLIDETEKPRDVTTENFQLEDTTPPKDPEPQIKSAIDYLNEINNNNIEMNNAIKANEERTKNLDEKDRQKSKSAIIQKYMEKNLAAADNGLECPNAKESEYLALAITKAEILVLKIHLYEDTDSQTLKIFLDSLKDSKDCTHRIVEYKANSLKSKILAYKFRKRLYEAADSNNSEELKTLVKEMDAELNNPKNVTPEQAQNAILLMLYIEKNPNFKQEEKLYPSYLDILSQSTNPKTKKIVEEVRAKIKQAQGIFNNATDTKAVGQKQNEALTKKQPNANNSQRASQTNNKATHPGSKSP